MHAKHLMCYHFFIGCKSILSLKSQKRIGGETIKKTPIDKDRRFAGHDLPGGNDAVDRGRFDYTTEGSEYHDNRLRIDSNMSM